MKASHYNFFFPYEADDSKMIAYNSFSNALALMEKDQYSRFNDFVKNGIDIDDEEFIQQLKQGSFLQEDAMDELAHLRLRMLQSRYQTRSLSLTIAPTADCNFRCPYCYEKDFLCNKYMSEELQQKIIDMVKSHARSISNLGIAWYGGEPLMAIDIIEKLSREFIRICEEHDIDYTATMVTNGYFLTRKNAELLRELKVSSIQITVDGAKEVHNTRRPLADGSGTFDTIMENMREAKELLPSVNLRINVDMDNIDSAKDVIDVVAQYGLGENVFPYLGRILPDNGEYESSRCFDTCGFSEVEFDHYMENLDDKSLLWKYPRTTSNVCAADSINSLIIAADGRIYKC